MNSNRLALVVTGLAIAGALVVLIDRGGLIAWTVLILGIALLGKIWRIPSRQDLGLSIGLVLVSILTWAGTLYYVISTYESGEVVELDVDTASGLHTARLWVMEVEAVPVVYMDAEPEVAEALLAGNPLQFTRAGSTSARTPDATEVDALSEDDATQVFEAMEEKYGGRMTAADVYYVVLGRPRDRIALVVKLVEQ